MRTPKSHRGPRHPYTIKRARRGDGITPSASSCTLLRADAVSRNLEEGCNLNLCSITYLNSYSLSILHFEDYSHREKKKSTPSLNELGSRDGLNEFHCKGYHMTRKMRHTRTTCLASVGRVLGRCVALLLVCCIFFLCMCVHSCLSWRIWCAYQCFEDSGGIDFVHSWFRCG